MILTNCAACAAPLAHDAPRCVRCKTRYCNSTCQHDHWRRGHKQICKKIHRAGNAEQYHADNKYKEAVKVAVEKCACSPRLAEKVASLPLVPVVVVMAVYIAVQAFVPALSPSPKGGGGDC